MIEAIGPVVFGLVANVIHHRMGVSREIAEDAVREVTFHEDVTGVKTVFLEAVKDSVEKRRQEGAIDEEAIDWDSVNWREVAITLTEDRADEAVPITLVDEDEVSDALAVAILDSQGYDREAAPDLYREVRGTIADTMVTVNEEFGERIRGTKLSDELDIESNRAIISQLDDLADGYREIRQQCWSPRLYETYPGTEDGCQRAAERLFEEDEDDRVEYLPRVKLTDRDEIGRLLVLGPAGSGKSRAMGELLADLAGRSSIEHVVVPNEPFQSEGDEEPFHAESFEGDVLLVMDDAHDVNPEQGNTVVRKAIDVLDEILSTNGHELHVLLSARLERVADLPDVRATPFDFAATEASLWEPFEVFELDAFHVGELATLFERALAQHRPDLAVEESVVAAFARKASENYPHPFYVTSAVRAFDDETRTLTVADIERIPDGPLEIWKEEYATVSESEAFLLQAVALLETVALPPFRPLVAGVYETVYADSRLDDRVVEGLVDQGWIRTRERNETELLTLHDIQQAAIGVPDRDLFALSEFLLDANLRRYLPRETDLSPGILHNEFGAVLRVGFDDRFDDIAADHFREAIDRNPDLALAHYNLGATLHVQGQFDAARRAYENAVDADPGFALAHTDLGYILQEQGQLDAAREAYENAIDADPGFALAHTNLGYILQEQGQLDAARRAFESAIDADSGFALAHYNLGALLEEQGEFDAAREAYENAVDTYPDFTPFSDDELTEEQGFLTGQLTFQNFAGPDFELAWAYNNLGTVLEKQNRLDAAREAYENAIDADPGFATAHYNLGVLLENQDELDAARRAFENAVDADPEDAEAHHALGCLLRDTDRTDAARQAFRDAVDADPDLAAAHYNLGCLLRDTDRTDAARQAFRNAVDADPTLASAHYNLGITLRADGQKGEAIGHFVRSTSLWLQEDSIADAINDLLVLGRTYNQFEDRSRAAEWREQALTLVERVLDAVDDPNVILDIETVRGSLIESQPRDIDSPEDLYESALLLVLSPRNEPAARAFASLWSRHDENAADRTTLNAGVALAAHLELDLLSNTDDLTDQSVDVILEAVRPDRERLSSPAATLFAVLDTGSAGASPEELFDRNATSGDRRKTIEAGAYAQLLGSLEDEQE